MASSELDRTKEVRRQSMEGGRDPAYLWAGTNGIPPGPERRGGSSRGNPIVNSRSPSHGGGSITSGLSAMSTDTSRSPRTKPVNNVTDDTPQHATPNKGKSNVSANSNSGGRSRTSSRSSGSTARPASPQQSDEESKDPYSQYKRLFKKKLYKDWSSKKQSSPKTPTTTTATSTSTTNSTDSSHHEETRYGKFRHWERKGTCSPASATSSTGNQGSGSTTSTPTNSMNHIGSSGGGGSDPVRSTTSRSSDSGTPTGRSHSHSQNSPPSRPGSAFHYPHMPTLHQQNLPPPTLSPHTPYNSASSVGSLPPHGTPTPPILTAQQESRPSSRPSSAGSSTHTPVTLPPLGPHSLYQAHRPAAHLISEGLVPYQPPASPLSRDSDTTAEMFSRPMMHPIKGVMPPHGIELANRAAMFSEMNGPHRGGPTPPSYPPPGAIAYNALLSEMNMIRAGSVANSDLLALNRPGAGFPTDSLAALYPMTRGGKDTDWKLSNVNNDNRVPSRP